MFMVTDSAKAMMEQGWKISPLATAVKLSTFTREGYMPAAHLRMLSDAVVDTVSSGGRLIVTLPPRHGKSHLISTYTPLWFLENWPDKYIINCGYGAEFSSEWGAKVRELIKDFQPLLTFSLKQDKQAAERWLTSEGGGMKTAGIGGGITGRGAHLLLIDDPIKNWDEASSWSHREKVWNWWTSSARTRVEPGGAVIVVLTRWNEDDLAGRLINKAAEDWRVMNFPAIYDEKAAKQGPCPLGRKLGDPLWPERYGIEALQVFQRQDATVWESLYQQRPGSVANLGNVYSSFKQKRNVKTVIRDPRLPLVWSLDFNRDPFCSVIGQYKEWFGPVSFLTNQKLVQVEILDEICLPDAGTPEMCEAMGVRIKEICGNHKTVVEVYGDPAAAARHTSQVAGSDYDIIRDFFRNNTQFDFRMNIGRKAPSIKERTNTVNGLFLNTLGEVRCVVDPRCKMLIRDLENVRWKRDLNGNTAGGLDKAQKDLTHISDALGYWLERRFNTHGSVGEQAGILQ